MAKVRVYSKRGRPAAIVDRDKSYRPEYWKRTSLVWPYRIKADKTIKHKSKEIKFKKGDEILVFKLYKYYIEELENFFKMYFSEIEISKDSDTEYILALCKK